MLRSQDSDEHRSAIALDREDTSVLLYPADGDEKCLRVFGHLPKPEQRIVTEHIGRGEDCILIAGCGWGKTLAYFLPLALWESRVIVVISPLVALMEKQHRKLQAQGISSIPVHSGRRLPDNLEEELIDGKYRAVFMSPEDAFSNKRFDMLWNAADWRSRVQAIIIDEAHCISTWGKEFRTDYSKIGELRSRFPPTTAFVAVSATLHGELLQDVRTCFHFDSNVAIIRADTDRPNVRYEVEMTEGSISTCYDALEAYLDSKKTIVYFDSLDELLAAYRHLLSKTRAASVSASASASATPIVQPGQIAAYFADLASETKMLYMSMFRKGEILMLLSTEAAEMSCDHPDILRVVQFRAPSSISVLAQRLGRAARAPDLQGTGILLYPQTDSITLSMDPQLQGYITANCRREYLNSVFENEHREVDNCCDLCSRRPTLGKPNYEVVRNFRRPAFSRPFKTKREPQQRFVAKERILAWRSVELLELQRFGSFFTEENIMNDKNVNLLSENFGDVAVAQDIKAIIAWSEPVRGSRQRLVDLLVAYNNEIDSQKRVGDGMQDHRNKRFKAI